MIREACIYASNLEEKVRLNEIKIRSKRTTNEMRTFIYKNGRPDHMEGYHDDCLMALGIALWIIGCFRIINMNRQILVVEDEAPIREMITFVLEQNGFNTQEAEDINQALSKIVEPYPALILLDWMLPGGTGVKLAKMIKQNEYTRNIPIIMLTARADEEDKVKGFDAGIDDYVTKPFSPKELEARTTLAHCRYSQHTPFLESRKSTASQEPMTAAGTGTSK